MVDADGRPRLLDFGIAKVLDPSPKGIDSGNTETIIQTLTPAYASPEQIRGQAITTATDVYSLGVVLYLLLTGRLPYQVDNEDLAEAERTICDVDPSAPSLNPPRGLRIAEDLDKVVLKALHKDPEQRYASVAEFSEDLRRFSVGLPVIARPDVWHYRTRRFVRRNRAVVAASLAALIALLAGTAFSTIQYWRADRVRDQLQASVEEDQRRVRELGALTKELGRSQDVAERQREIAEEHADQLGEVTARLAVEKKAVEAGRRRAEESAGELAILNEQLEAEQQVAEHRFMDVWTVANAFIFDIQDALSLLPGSLRAREVVAGLGLEYLDRLAEGSGDNNRLRADLVQGFLRLARVRDSLAIPGESERSDQEDGTLQALEIAEHLFEEDQLSPESAFVLGAALLGRGDRLRIEGRGGEALELYERGARVCGILENGDPPNAYHRSLLGAILGLLGHTYRAMGRFGEAREAQERALSVYRSCVDELPSVRVSLCGVEYDLARMIELEEGTEAAMPSYERVVEQFRRLAEEHPEDPAHTRGLMVTLLELATGYSVVGKYEEMQLVSKEALQCARELAAAAPDSLQAQSDLVAALRHRASGYKRTGDPQRTLELAREAVELATHLSGHNPRIPFLKQELCMGLNQLASAEQAMSLMAESRSHLNQCLKIVSEGVEAAPDDVLWNIILSDCHSSLGGVYEQMAEEQDHPPAKRVEWLRESLRHNEEGLRIIEGLEARGAGSPERRGTISKYGEVIERLKEKITSLESISPAPGGGTDRERR